MEGQILKLRTSGYLFYQCYVIISCCALFELFLIYSTITRRGVTLPFVVLALLGFYCAVVFYKIASTQAIELTPSELIVYSTFGQKTGLIPKARKQTMKLSHIGYIAIGKLKDLNLHGRGPNSLTAVIVNHNILLPLPLSYAIKFSTVMVVTSKNGHETVLTSLKPFANADIRRLVKELLRRQCSVIIDPTLRGLA